jgi:probable rRNA maturation factor
VTDVLSFPMEDEFGSEYDNVILGDVVISIDKIKEQALEFNHSFERELAYLFVHSLLHLFGYDHIDDEDKVMMRTEEKSIMDKLKLYK